MTHAAQRIVLKNSNIKNKGLKFIFNKILDWFSPALAVCREQFVANVIQALQKKKERKKLKDGEQNKQSAVAYFLYENKVLFFIKSNHYIKNGPWKEYNFKNYYKTCPQGTALVLLTELWKICSLLIFRTYQD